MIGQFGVSQKDLLMHAAYCLAFAGFLRIGEITYSFEDRQKPDFKRWHVIRSSVCFFKDSMTLTIPSSKTRFKEDVTVTIAAVNDEIAR